MRTGEREVAERVGERLHGAREVAERVGEHANG
jgi:hypothetical protein